MIAEQFSELIGCRSGPKWLLRILKQVSMKIMGTSPHMTKAELTGRSKGV